VPAAISASALDGIPEIRPGDDLAQIIASALAGRALRDEDVLVIAHKIVSKAEGQIVDLRDVTPDERARELAAEHGKGEAHPGSAVNTGSLYKLAWYALFGFVNGATALGIAQGAIEEFTSATRARVATASGQHIADFATMQLRLAEAATLIDAAETLMLKDCGEATNIAEEGRSASIAEKARWRRDGAFAVRLAVRAIDILFTGAGGSAIVETHPLQRALRDAHAAQGHIGLNWDLNGTMYGRVALGLDPEFPLL